MVVMVIIALEVDPLAIKLTAKPKPIAATTARRTGFSATPPLISGPLAQTAPVKAILMPINWVEFGFSPFINAIVSGIRTLREAIGETTPILPVANPV
ncbi:unannotated protein [freshwater metagenome]|uniref:Unannotated protein n=1 Tax=freshwater metagenome TaxID=449393 RepID=A0A6J7VW05_9ZZZZ